MRADNPIRLAADLPDGRELVAEGRRMGETVEVGVTAFCESRGVRSEVHFKAAQAEAGELSWSMIMGLSSVDEQVAGLRYLHNIGESSGAVIHRGLVIPNWVSGLPPRLRQHAPPGTSFVLDGDHDHRRIAEAAPIQPCFNDWHIGSPYCLANTAAAIRAGGSYHGVLAQMTWCLPPWKDDVASVAENIKAIGMVSAKRDDWMVVDSYMDDGMPSHFLDYASLVGYALLEKYVVEDLCGARYATGFGGLMSDIPTKVSVWLALHQALEAEHPCLSYIFGNTIAPRERHIVQNFGIVAAEYAVFAAAEHRYKTGVSMLPIPITEGLQVPTPQAIAEARLVAGMAAERGGDLERFIRWDIVERQRDVLVEQGRRFFDNALALLRDGGVDIGDPLQVLLSLKSVGAARLEALCHPGDRDSDRPHGIVPFVSTELYATTGKAVQSELAKIHARGLQEAVQRRLIMVASADAHWFGAYAVGCVLKELGAEVVELGCQLDPEAVAVAVSSMEDAMGVGRLAVALSMHNGQCLGYINGLVAELDKHRCSCDVYVGGRLNAILEGDTQPSDASNLLRRMGVSPCADITQLVEQLETSIMPRI